MLRAADIYEPGRLEFKGDGRIVPHPEMLTSAKPCSGEFRGSFRPHSSAKPCAVHESQSRIISRRLKVLCRDCSQVGNHETKAASPVEISGGIQESPSEVFKRKVFEHMGAIDPRATPRVERETFDDVSVTDRGRKFRILVCPERPSNERQSL
jgi:hypothetical protein